MVIDARGVPLSLSRPLRRIVSLVPSTTESIFALGCGDRLVGVTRFCVHPDDARTLPKVGGTKDADPDRILRLQPDLVVGNCEENTRELFDALEGHVPLFAAFPRTVDDAIRDLRTLGQLLDVDASPLTTAIAASRPPPTATRRRAAYLIWRGPWMTVSDDTFIGAMLHELGLDNVFGPSAVRFPTFEPEALASLSPDLVLLSDEPFRFRDRHADELATLTGLPRDRFRLTDGSWWSWHGARLATALPALRAELAA